MFEDALRYPFGGSDWVQTIVVRSVLTLLGFLVVPVVFVWGYSLRVMRRVSAGATEPPAWNEWGDLFVEGLRALVVGAVYLLVPGLLVLASVAAFLVPLARQPPRLLSLVAVVVALVSVPLFVLAAYAVPAALVRVAVTRRLGAGLAFGQVWLAITTGEYLVAWLLALVVSLLAGLVTGLAALTLVGSLLGAVVGFYALVATSYLYARGVADAGVGPPLDSDATERL